MIKKTLKYLRYIILHKWYVGKECFKRGLYWQGLIHDWHKLVPSEFVPYREFFYGDRKLWQRAFTYAWNSHQKRAKHHWQYWVILGDNGKTEALEMPDKYRNEMIADWIGVGLTLFGRVTLKEWYAKNKFNIKLHPITKQLVEEEIESL